MFLNKFKNTLLYTRWSYLKYVCLKQGMFKSRGFYSQKQWISFGNADSWPLDSRCHCHQHFGQVQFIEWGIVCACWLHFASTAAAFFVLCFSGIRLGSVLIPNSPSQWVVGSSAVFQYILSARISHNACFVGFAWLTTTIENNNKNICSVATSSQQRSKDRLCHAHTNINLKFDIPRQSGRER